jgi:ATP-dependent exoDNAse (exonuclease V) beta subunit
LLKEFLAEKVEHQVQDDEVSIYRFGIPNFRNPKEKTIENEPVAMTDSVSVDWFQKINVDPDPTSLWHSESERLLPREWGDLVHQVLAKICTADEVEKVLRPYLSDSTIDPEAADWIRDKFNQMASHPLISSAFAPSAKVKTECEILHQGKVLRLDRLAELPDIIYLLDYKTGKKDPKHNKQLNDYISAIKSMTDKEVRGYLVYLSEEGIEVVDN